MKEFCPQSGVRLTLATMRVINLDGDLPYSLSDASLRSPAACQLKKREQEIAGQREHSLGTRRSERPERRPKRRPGREPEGLPERRPERRLKYSAYHRCCLTYARQTIFE